MAKDNDLKGTPSERGISGEQPPKTSADAVEKTSSALAKGIDKEKKESKAGKEPLPVKNAGVAGEGKPRAKSKKKKSPEASLSAPSPQTEKVDESNKPAEQKGASQASEPNASPTEASGSKPSQSEASGAKVAQTKARESKAPEPAATAETKPKPEIEKSVPAKPGASAERKSSNQASGKNKRSGLVLWLLILMLLAGLAASLYWIYLQQNQSGGELQSQIESQQNALSRIEQSLLSERRERLAQDAVLQQLSNELQLRITSQSNRLRELSTTTRSDWLLAEAEYLMRLANQRLVTERDTRNPAALLETADQILRDLDDVDLFPVREALAKDITALKVAVNVDREGLFLRLEALSQQLVLLPLLERNPAGDRVELEEPVDSESTEQTWQEKLMGSLSRAGEHLSELVRVKSRSAPVEPLLSPDEEVFLRHNLRIMLEQAQLSLLREEQAVYSANLTKAERWLRQYFALNDGAGALADELAQMADQPVVQQLPDISTSLEALRGYIDFWHKRHEAPEQNSESLPAVQGGAEPEAQT